MNMTVENNMLHLLCQTNEKGPPMLFRFFLFFLHAVHGVVSAYLSYSHLNMSYRMGEGHGLDSWASAGGP